MRRFFVTLLALACLTSPADAAPDKTLIMVPGNEYANTVWMRYFVPGIIIEGGGEYHIINMAADSAEVEMLREVATGEYGMAIFIIQAPANFCATGQPNYLNGTFAKYVSASASPTSLGIPAMLLCRNTLARNTSYTAKLYTGVITGGNWTKGALGGGAATGSADSLWARFVTGDSLLWPIKAASADNVKHLLDIDAAQVESAYLWTVDAWTKRGVGEASKAVPYDSASIYAWHVHLSAYDAAEVPGAGQDSVIYYIPNCNYLGYTYGYDSEMKMVATILKKFNCIRDIPFAFEIADFGVHYTTTGGMTEDSLWVRIDSLLQWFSDRELPITCGVQYYRSDGDTATTVTKMAQWYSDPYIRFYNHTGVLYANAAKSSTYSVFGAWGDGATEKAAVLRRDLERQYYLMGTSGMLAYMEDADCLNFDGGWYSGHPSYIKQDTIFSALAAEMGIRKFMVATQRSGHVAYSTSGKFTIFDPIEQYPLDLTWTGDAQVVNVEIKTMDYGVLEGSAAGDTVYADPGAMTDSAIVVIGSGCSAASYIYRDFDRALLGNGRNPDGTAGGADWTVSNAYFDERYPLSDRGVVYALHYVKCLTRNGGVWYNTPLLWAKHVWNNLRAYNNLAKEDDATIGNVFEPVHWFEMDQKVGKKD